MKKKSIKAIILAVLISCPFSNMYAQTPGFVQPFELDPLTDGIIGGTSLSLAGSALLCGKVFHIKPNNFGGSVLDKSTVNSFDRFFMQNYDKTFDLVADGLMAFSLTMPAIMFANQNTNWLTVGVMYTEALALAYGIKEWGKLIITRPRPYMYFDDFPVSQVEKGDWHCSMPSGHTTIAFTTAAFTSAVFNEYFPSSPWRHVVTGVSFGIATTVGIFRMLSGNHFFTDVIAGAVIGTLCGFIVPFFHSQTFNNLTNRKGKPQTSASPLGLNVKFVF